MVATLSSVAFLVKQIMTMSSKSKLLALVLVTSATMSTSPTVRSSLITPQKNSKQKNKRQNSSLVTLHTLPLNAIKLMVELEPLPLFLFFLLLWLKEQSLGASASLFSWCSSSGVILLIYRCIISHPIHCAHCCATTSTMELNNNFIKCNLRKIRFFLG